jgi:hypothetical protein
MTARAGRIGFSQRVRLEWLERAANLHLAGHDGTWIRGAMQELLKDKVSVGSQAKWGSRGKIVSIILKTWVTVPSELESLRLEGLRLLERLPPARHLAVHWGMVMAAYPFWAGVASQTGRLLRLQRSASAAQIQRRVREQYGERETVSRATRRIIRSYLDWGALQETGTAGVYKAGAALSVDDSRLGAWLVEASLHSRANGTAILRDLLDGPALFPFRVGQVNVKTLAAESPRLDLLRQGTNDDLVMLRKPKAMAEPLRRRG